MIKTTYERLQELDTFTLKVLSQGQGLNPEVKDLIEHILFYERPHSSDPSFFIKNND